MDTCDIAVGRLLIARQVPSEVACLIYMHLYQEKHGPDGIWIDLVLFYWA